MVEKKWIGLGEFIKAERRHSGMSREEVGVAVGKGSATVASWEQGYRRPKQGSLLGMARLFGVDIQQLQVKAGFTPEFDWYRSLRNETATEEDILLSATELELEELRRYLHYLRFEKVVMPMRKPHVVGCPS
jgi:transcriptional regulator with XRE-family HTH domain